MKHAHLNILEHSTVSLAAGTEDSSYPLRRIHDRMVSRIFKTTAAVTVDIRIEQPAGDIRAVDRLLIPEGHNLDGMTIDIMHSDDDVTYTPAVTQWVQSGTGLIDKSWTSLAKRYWKFLISAPASIPEIAEIFLTSTYGWDTPPVRPMGPVDYELNMQAGRTAYGADRFLNMGPRRRQRNYRVTDAPDTQADAVLALQRAFGESGPFFLYDHDDTWIFGRLRSDPGLVDQFPGLWAYELNFTEVLD